MAKMSWNRILKYYKGSDLVVLKAWKWTKPLDWDWKRHLQDPEVNCYSSGQKLIAKQAVALLKIIVDLGVA